MDHIVLRHRNIPGLDRLDTYLANGGFEAFKRVVTTMKPEEVIEVVKTSGLRGRGGAGFPTGVKWSFLTKNRPTYYVVANSDESEPGTFKDREIMEKNPFQFLEGVMIAAYAARANVAYNYMRGEFWSLAKELDQKIEELRATGFLGKNIFGTSYALEVHIHLGAGAYICGEESALLESIEGKLGQPRLKPPFPADKGLYNMPTVVNNTETLTNVPMIIAKGAEWYKAIGVPNSAGTKVMCLSGHVNKPGNYEFPFGLTLRELIYDHAGGVPAGKKVKAVMLSGASSVVLPGTDDILDMKLDYDSVAAKGSALGSASIIVMDETVDMSWVLLKTTRFFKHESCGKCTPCREGTYWMLNIMERLNKDQVTKADIDLLNNVASQVQGKCLCPLGEFAVTPMLSGLKIFRADFETHVKNGAKPKPVAKPVVKKAETVAAGG